MSHYSGDVSSYVARTVYISEISTLCSCRPFVKNWTATFFPWRNSASGPGPPHYRGITITLTHSTFGRTPLDQWSARRKYLYVTAHITRKRQTYMPPARFELRVPASERPHTHVLDRVATGTGNWGLNLPQNEYVDIMLTRVVGGCRFRQILWRNINISVPPLYNLFTSWLS